jgi:hypothetical protein
MLSDAPATLDLSPFLDIFGRWRHEKDHAAGWVDLADYAHVPRGAGIVLVGFNANFAFDMTDDGGRSSPGILYAAKRSLTGSYAERLSTVLKSCFELTRRLMAEKEFPRAVRLRSDALEIRFADRLVTPNTKEMYEELCPAVLQVLDRLYGPTSTGCYQVTPYSDPDSDPAEVLGCSVKAQKAEPLETLVQCLS